MRSHAPREPPVTAMTVRFSSRPWERRETAWSNLSLAGGKRPRLVDSGFLARGTQNKTEVGKAIKQVNEMAPPLFRTAPKSQHGCGLSGNHSPQGGESHGPAHECPRHRQREAGVSPRRH